MSYAWMKYKEVTKKKIRTGTKKENIYYFQWAVIRNFLLQFAVYQWLGYSFFLINICYISHKGNILNFKLLYGNVVLIGNWNSHYMNSSFFFLPEWKPFHSFSLHFLLCFTPSRLAARSDFKQMSLCRHDESYSATLGSSEQIQAIIKLQQPQLGFSSLQQCFLLGFLFVVFSILSLLPCSLSFSMFYFSLPSKALGLYCKYKYLNFCTLNVHTSPICHFYMNDIWMKEYATFAESQGLFSMYSNFTLASSHGKILRWSRK